MGVIANLLLTGALAAIIVAAHRPLFALFLGADSPAVPIAGHIQAICTWSFMLSGVMMVLTGTMRSYGAVLVPLAIMFVSFYPARMGFYFVAHPVLGGEALWWAYPASSTVSVVLTWLAYTRGSWRNQRDEAYGS